MAVMQEVAPYAVYRMAPTPPKVELRYVGTGGGLFFVGVKNLLLTLVTLGIYLPWARTERRKYLWQNVEIGGQRLRYHGTGGEIFVGYLKVALVYIVLFGVPMGISMVSKIAGFIAQAVGIFAVFFLIPIAIYGSRRYRLSRTSLRGVRFGLEPGAKGFLRLYVVTFLLSAISFGLYAPIGQNHLHGYLTSKSRYGSERFGYDGSDSDAWRIMFVGMLLSMATLGIYYPWFIAEFARFRLSHTVFQGARGQLDLTGGDVWKILLVSVFGTIFSLGIAIPWITTYALRTVTSKISFYGQIDYARVEQRPVEGGAAADDLASALDVGIDL
jgi:uncharacterized membrane protein YjgN (DUF898 family)